MISHAQRMAKKSNDFVGSYDPTYEVFAEETFAQDGRVLKRSVVKKMDMSEFMAQYSADDFRIENLAAVGALQDNKRYTYNPSTMEMMDNVGAAFDYLTDVVDNNNVNNTNE